MSYGSLVIQVMEAWRDSHVIEQRASDAFFLRQRVIGTNKFFVTMNSTAQTSWDEEDAEVRVQMNGVNSDLFEDVKVDRLVMMV